MGETNNTGGEEFIDTTENNGADQGESQNSGADATDKGTDTTDADNTDKGDDGADGDKSKDKTNPTADEEPKTRKRNIDFIIERKNKQIERLKDKAGGQQDDESDDDIDDDDAKIIQKQVAKVLSPFLAKQMQDEDTQEIGDFVKANPDFAPYSDKVKRFAQHPSRKDMPIQSIFYEVAGNDLLKIGAERAKKADKEAKDTRAGGGNGTTIGGEKSVWDLSPEEFAKKQDELRQKSR